MEVPNLAADIETQRHLLPSDKCQDEKETLELASSSSGSSGNMEDIERGKWASQMEFILACVGYSVGLGNIMRFPYLCMRSGGGAFLIPFFFFMIVCGFPLYYLEVCLGQFSSSSPLFVWRLAPLLKGLGWLMVLISGVVSWYYNMILAWVLYYLFNSFQSTLPWSTCNNSWNTKYCRPTNPRETTVKLESDISNHSESLLGNITYDSAPLNNSADTITGNVSSAKEFWQYRLLGQSSSLDDVGTVQWHLVLSLLGAWILVFLCLVKGVKSVGKVVYVTALLPFVLLTIFFIRGLTLPGASDGVKFYIYPNFERLLDSQVWLEAAVQVSYSLGPTWGGVITMASYNKFTNNCLRDSLIACLADSLTSFFAGFVIFPIIGYMAYELKQPIEEVATSGPGLMFIAYPEAIAKMPLPHLWAILFFIMLITVGLDTQFGMFETLSSGVVDAFPKKLSNKKTLVTATLSAGMFLLGLPFTTNAGIYVYQLVDWYSSSLCMCLGGCLEFVAVAWYYGAERFSRDMELMLGYRAPIFLRICWCLISPSVFFIVFIVMLTRYESVTYLGYTYPQYATIIGILLSLVPVFPLPAGMLMGIWRTRGNLPQRLRQLMKPENWGPGEKKYREDYLMLEKPRARGLKDFLAMNLIGRWMR